MRQAAAHHYEDFVRHLTGTKTIPKEVHGYELDGVNDHLLVEVKTGGLKNEKPNYKGKRSMRRKIAFAQREGLELQYWFRDGVNPKLRAYLEKKGIVVKVGGGD